jgi:GTP-binding protein EngB required for normal cell division
MGVDPARSAGPALADRLAALDEAVDAGIGALPDQVVERAREVRRRAGERVLVSEQHTVVAIAGATGSGKSSLVNALAGREVTRVDVLRPTTDRVTAVAHPPEGAGPLLDWLGVADRVTPPHADADGLVVLDLPDHDSVVTEHRLEAERLVAVVDLMVWVVDPQKYADAAVHDRYLSRLGAHRDVVLVVLNQVDRLEPAERSAVERDLRRLLVADGLDVPVLAVSARTGEGVAELRAALVEAAARREAAVLRWHAETGAVARQVLEACGSASPARPVADGRLVDALAVAAGVPVVARAVEGSVRAAARHSTGWPPVRWVGRLRADPLATLHLTGRGAGGAGALGHRPGSALGLHGGRVPGDAGTVRTSLPRPGPAELARAQAAVRDWQDRATTGLPDAWRARVTPPHPEVLADALDQAVAATPLTRSRRPAWWGVVGALQWLWLAAAVAGAGWLGVLAGLGALRLPAPEPPAVGSVPLPTLLVAAGIALGLVTAGLAGLVAAAGARRQARRATAALRSAVAATADAVVVGPVSEVVERHARCRAAAERAAGPPADPGPRPGRLRRPKEQSA